jgi:hypothetical protein
MRITATLPLPATQSTVYSFDHGQRCNDLPIPAAVCSYRILQRHSFNFLSSSAVHLPTSAVIGSMLDFNVLSHLLRHCFCVRPGICSAIAFQFLPPCSRTPSFKFLSSSAVHLPARAVVGSNTNLSCHLLRHCFCVRPGTSAVIAFQLLAP